MPTKKSKTAPKKAAEKSKAASHKTKSPAKKSSLKKSPPKPKKVVIKTQETNADVNQYLNSVKDEQQRKDSFKLIEMMSKATGDKPKLWGNAIIGFGNVVFTSPNTGRSVDWMKIGFAPRKANLSLYLTVSLGSHGPELKKLGKHKTGGGCIYIKKLDDVDLKILQGMIDKAAKKNSR